MAAQTQSAVVGRDEELATLGRFVALLEDGPAACLLEGEAGIGKTTLWRHALELARAQSVRVLAAGPNEAETQLSFAALSDLLEGVLADALPVAPEPQRRALEVALLLAAPTAAPPDHRAVAAATLTVVRTVAASGPLLLAVDDVQWLDSSSAAVLAFAVRRLRDEPVGLLLAQRRRGSTRTPLGLERALPAERLCRVQVGPLDPGALHRLLRERLDAALPRPTLLRVHEAAGGNPFFALEIARSLTSGGSPEPGTPLPLPRTLDELVHDRLAVLPPATRELLAAAAAVSQPTVSLLRAGWGDGVASRLRPALEAEVLSIDRGQGVAFAHPLLAPQPMRQPTGCSVVPFTAASRRSSTTPRSAHDTWRLRPTARTGRPRTCWRRLLTGRVRVAPRSLRWTWRSRRCASRPRSRPPHTAAGSTPPVCTSKPGTPRAQPSCSTKRSPMPRAVHSGRARSRASPVRTPWARTCGWRRISTARPSRRPAAIRSSGPTQRAASPWRSCACSRTCPARPRTPARA